MEHIKFNIPFGNEKVTIRVPCSNYIKPKSKTSIKPLLDPENEINRSLINPVGTIPLKEMSSEKKNACIVISDITRNIPYRIVLPPVLRVLHASGIKKKNIRLLVAVGSHKVNTEKELRLMIGDDIFEKYNIITHDCLDDSINVEIGKTKDGNKIKINRNFIDSDLKILTGGIVPHGWAGFSGGPKSICPGIASAETIKVTHSPRILNDPSVQNGVLEGNIFYEITTDIGSKAKVDFVVNVVLNENKDIMGVFSGDLIKAHTEGAKLSKKFTTITYPDYLDIVIAGGGGYPLDTYLYQSVRALYLAKEITRKNGTIILVAECDEGIGHEGFEKQLHKFNSMEEYEKDILNKKDFELGQWGIGWIYGLAEVADIYIYSYSKSIDKLPSNIFKRTTNIQKLLNGLINKKNNSKIGVLKDGTFYIFKVKKKSKKY